MEDLIGKIWLYAVAILIMIAPFYLFYLIHKWAKGYLKKQQDVSDLTKKIESLKEELSELKNSYSKLHREKINQEKLAKDLYDRIDEMKQTWKSPWDQTIENIKVSVNSSIPINKVVKTIPKDMTDEELQSCLDEYSRRLKKNK